MINLTNYDIKEELYSGEKSVVYRAVNQNKPVILKYLNHEYPSYSELNRFMDEYDFLKKFQLEYSIKPIRIEKYKNSLVLVFEDIGAVSLANLLKSKKYFSINEFLDSALEIAKAVKELGKNHIIHKDIKPHNIICNPTTCTYKIIDFGSASLLSKENPEIRVKDNLEGTLAYISPEQTGRMNCNLDYRTDYYSMGITFYQMLTGELPFKSKDPSELVHAHIAVKPIAPTERKKDIPPVISDIVLKLIRKLPEERYQTMEGLIYDLERCKELLESNNQFTRFSIGTKDISTIFKIPEKIYGRKEEHKQILEVFQKARVGNTEFVLVNGLSGIGKTALISEMNKPITECRGYFITGKYDKYKRDIPYWAIINAFQNLIRQVLSESEEKISYWKKEILNVVGSNGKVITDVIPELEAIIGKQPDVVELAPLEALNRFNLVFQEFVNVLCKEENPVLLFLDDLQWADLPSFQLLKSMLTGNARFILFVLSYRSNEVNAGHPLATLLEDLKKIGKVGVSIHLDFLGEEAVNKIVADTLHLKLDDCKDLSRILHNKTNGNPFFINELFTSFYKEGLVYFHSTGWKYDIDKIKKASVSENVIDLMIDRMKKLSSEKVGILKLASCVGNRFGIDVFAGIKDIPEIETRKYIEELANDGYFLVGGNEVRFNHDKVLESAYAITTPEERILNHYLIGKRYLALTDKKEYNLEDNIFTIVNQLNQGLIYTTKEEKKQLIELNLLAGNKALSSSAYEVGLSCYRIAMELLPETYWESNYTECFEIYRKRAKLEFLNNHHEQADEFFKLILSKTKSILEKVYIYEMQIPLYVGQNRLQEALDIGLKALSLLGIDFPEVHDPTPEVQRAFLLLGERNLEDLINFPEMDSLENLTIMRILKASVVPAYISLPSLFPLVILKMVNITLGTSTLAKESGFAFIFFGVILASGSGNYELGYNLGQLGIRCIEKLDAKETKCSSYFIFACMNSHWRNHANISLPYYLESIKMGLEYGDFSFASYSINHYNIQSILMRKNLLEIRNNLTKFSPNFDKLGQDDARKMFSLNYETVLTLMGNTDNPLVIKGKSFNEEETVPIWIEVKNATNLFNFYVNKLTLSYLFGSPLDAYLYARQAEPYAGGCFGMMLIVEHNFFDSLSCISLYQSEADSEKQKYLDRVKLNQVKLKLWGENSIYNYGHKFHIVEALLAGIDGKRDEVAEHLDLAIKLASESEFILEEALANEYYSLYWKELGREKYAELHRKEAHYAYKKWGCLPKVKQLEEKYSELKQQVKQKFSTETTYTSTATEQKSNTTNFLDLNSVIKASQAISGEIQLAKLLEKMMNLLFENAGAERGVFILKNNQEWNVEAEGSVNSQVKVLAGIPLQNYNDLSKSIVNYVARTKSIVLLDDAFKKGMFINDDYVKTLQPKSILCYPILNHGSLIGIVYLENNLTTDAFTSERVEILKVLSSQIAVSVENSLLYSSLEEKVEERTRDLNEALVEVRDLKEQQDGDYFLNTLLIEPLAQNNAFSKNVKIDFFIKQKKQFVFRNSKYELGGDINISENIELFGSRYTVFLNGDAMGKSIQGAGGVLVLGTVFKSIIQRTISTPEGKIQYPERWLKNTFIEIHKAFESFDGSMLMSAIFGLIDERTGTMYYMSAEHPKIVLYRDGIASFVESNYSYRKLGTQGLDDQQLSINVFALKPDDVIILGSDGRDDIIIGVEENTGYDIINQDENLFLNHVMESNADLKEIYSRIAANGKLMDDLSLLKIEYVGQAIDRRNLENQLKLLRDYKFQEKYHQITEVGLELVSNFPHISEPILDVVKAFNKLGEYERAIDFAERLRLRNPENLENLENLISSYSKIGNKDRAKYLFEVYTRMNPDLEKIKNLEKEI